MKQSLENVDIISFVRIIRLNWIVPIITMDSNRKVYQVINNNPQGNDEESDQNSFCISVQTDI
jgi:hypothetical protein